jgi:hypothetical protein
MDKRLEALRRQAANDNGPASLRVARPRLRDRLFTGMHGRWGWIGRLRESGLNGLRRVSRLLATRPKRLGRAPRLSAAAEPMRAAGPASDRASNIVGFPAR